MKDGEPSSPAFVDVVQTIYINHYQMKDGEPSLPAFIAVVQIISEYKERRQKTEFANKLTERLDIERSPSTSSRDRVPP